MKIVIVGAGGVGGYFGGRLAVAGNDVTFIARGEHLKAIQLNGLKVFSINGDFQINPAKATNNYNSISSADLIIIAVKAWQVKEVAQNIIPLINDNTVVLPLQNGVLAVEEINQYIDKKNIIGGLCKILSKIESPGIINHFSYEPTIVFGELDNQPSERVLRIKELFDKSGINSYVAKNIDTELWKKFLTICISGLGALTQSTQGELREYEGTRELIKKLFTEIYTLAIKMNIHLPEDIVEKSMVHIDSLDCKTTTSLQRDVMEGRPSEIEYQNGTVVKLGEKFGVDTPVNKFIYDCIIPMEKRARNK